MFIYVYSETLTNVRSEGQQDDTQDNTQDGIQDDIQDDVQDENQQNSHDDTQESIEEKTPTTNDINQQHPHQSRHTPKTKKRKIDSTLDILNKREAQRSVLYEKLLKRNSPPPPPKISALKKFFDSMADIVEGFPARDQADIRLKVCQIVTETEKKLATPQFHYGENSVPSYRLGSAAAQAQYVSTPALYEDSNSTPQTQSVETTMSSAEESNFTWL